MSFKMYMYYAEVTIMKKKVTKYQSIKQIKIFVIYESVYKKYT